MSRHYSRNRTPQNPLTSLSLRKRKEKKNARGKPVRDGNQSSGGSPRKKTSSFLTARDPRPPGLRLPPGLSARGETQPLGFRKAWRSVFPIKPEGMNGAAPARSPGGSPKHPALGSRRSRPGLAAVPLLLGPAPLPFRRSAIQGHREHGSAARPGPGRSEGRRSRAAAGGAGGRRERVGVGGGEPRYLRSGASRRVPRGPGRGPGGVGRGRRRMAGTAGAARETRDARPLTSARQRLPGAPRARPPRAQAPAPHLPLPARPGVPRAAGERSRRRRGHGGGGGGLRRQRLRSHSHSPTMHSLATAAVSSRLRASPGGGGTALGMGPRCADRAGSESAAACGCGGSLRPRGGGAASPRHQRPGAFGSCLTLLLRAASAVPGLEGFPAR